MKQTSKELSVYERLFGVKPCIHASYAYSTKQGGALPHPDVVKAMAEGANYYVDVPALLRESGKKIAKMLGVEAAFITSGACAGLTLASAAAMTGLDIRLMEQLPNTEYPVKMKNELIMELGHSTHYIGCLKAPGTKLLEVGGTYQPCGRMAGATWEEVEASGSLATREAWDMHPIVYDEAKKQYFRVLKVLPWHIENAINERTAALVYVRSSGVVRGETEVPLDEVVRIAHKYSLPVIVDCAAEAYKKANLTWAWKKGADLVIFSGGKDLKGPNDTGLIIGRKDLIEACSLNSSPHYRIIIGRGFKVSREQIVGLYVAIEKFLEADEEAESQLDIDRCHYAISQFKDFPHVEASLYIPDDEVEATFPYSSVHLKIDEQALGVTAYDISTQLWKEDPPIYVNIWLAKWGIVPITPRGMKEREMEYVTEHIKRALSKNLK